MLEDVHITHFQSLHDVRVKLAGFTCIVGPSSSGKSAFTRALRTLTSNQRGDSFISHGENQTIIKAKTDKGTVALLRGKKNEYVIIPEDEALEQKTYTKLNGNTPEEVSAFIGIPSKDPLNYSNQFDMPYLLTSSAAEVARTLGELTNVSVIFEASREANRQRLQASSTLKTRAGDYASLTVNLDKYATLDEDGQRIEQAEQTLSEAKSLQTRIMRLESIITGINEVPDVEVVVVPDVESVEELHDRVKRLATIVKTLNSAYNSYSTAVEQAHELSLIAEQHDAEYLETLREAGTCPTCGQGTEHVH